MLLFFRVALTKTLSWMLLFTGWYLVAFIVIIGPAAVERPERGPYFGPTGYWLVSPFVFAYSHSHPVFVSHVQVLDYIGIPAPAVLF